MATKRTSTATTKGSGTSRASGSHRAAVVEHIAGDGVFLPSSKTKLFEALPQRMNASQRREAMAVLTDRVSLPSTKVEQLHTLFGKPAKKS
jgi:hypothetical protein